MPGPSCRGQIRWSVVAQDAEKRPNRRAQHHMVRGLEHACLDHREWHHERPRRNPGVPDVGIVFPADSCDQALSGLLSGWAPRYQSPRRVLSFVFLKTTVFVYNKHIFYRHNFVLGLIGRALIPLSCGDNAQFLSERVGCKPTV